MGSYIKVSCQEVLSRHMHTICILKIQNFILINNHVKIWIWNQQECAFKDLYWSSRPEVFCKMVFLETPQDWQENTCARVSFSIKKETLTQMLSCQFCEVSKNTFFHRRPLVAASVFNASRPNPGRRE